MAAAGFLSRYMSGSLPYVCRHITVNKNMLNITFPSFLPSFLPLQLHPQQTRAVIASVQRVCVCVCVCVCVKLGEARALSQSLLLKLTVLEPPFPPPPTPPPPPPHTHTKQQPHNKNKNKQTNKQQTTTITTTRYLEMSIQDIMSMKINSITENKFSVPLLNDV